MMHPHRPLVGGVSGPQGEATVRGEAVAQGWQGTDGDEAVHAGAALEEGGETAQVKVAPKPDYGKDQGELDEGMDEGCDTSGLPVSATGRRVHKGGEREAQHGAHGKYK